MTSCADDYDDVVTFAFGIDGSLSCLTNFPGIRNAGAAKLLNNNCHDLYPLKTVTYVGTRGIARGGEFIDRHHTCHLRASTHWNSRFNDKFFAKVAIQRVHGSWC